MGRIMLATSASTDEEYGGTFVARADEIEPVLVHSIPANTYSTWADALTAFKPYFNALSASDKRKCVIVRNNDVVYHCNTLGGVFTATYPLSATINTIVGLYLNGPFAVQTTLSGNSSQTADILNSPQNQLFEMYII